MIAPLRSSWIVGAAAFVAAHALASARAAVRANTLPTVQVQVLTESEADDYSEVRVRVTVADADGDRVSARLLNGPPRLWMAPIADQLPAATREILWYTHPQAGGYWRIVVEAHDDVEPGKLVRGEARLHVTSTWSPGTLVVDLDGDGGFEVVARAPRDDVGSTVDAGSLLHLVRGASSTTASRSFPFAPPGTSQIARRFFVAASPLAGDLLGAAFCATADVTGDGVDDLLAVSLGNGGAIQVWFGGARGAATPSSMPAGRPSDAKLLLQSVPSFEARASYLVGDVTGDGVADVIVADPLNSAVASYGGRIHLFEGGPNLAGVHAATAIFELSAPGQDDYFPLKLRLDDVTGDGVADVVAAGPWVDVNGVVNQGEAAVFAGGPGLTGSVVPTALLLGRVAANARLGEVSNDYGLYTVDLDADGQRDVVVGAQYSGVGGEIYFWRGGSTLAGTPPADATLVDTRTNRSFELGYTSSGDGIQFADVTGDGLLDVVAADIGAMSFAGLVKVWAGASPFTGTRAITASLGDGIAQNSGFLTGFEEGWRIVDVTGDAIPDVVAAAPQHKISNVAGTGAVYVWKGGTGMSGTPAPSAKLVVTGAHANDFLGKVDAVTTCAGMQIIDVTGDAVADLVVPAALADEGGIVDAGALYLFQGGATLTGTVNPLARLVGPSPVAGDRLAGAWKWTSTGPFNDGSFAVVDVTGDGLPDVIAVAQLADTGALVDAGSIDVWEGGASLTGTKTPRAQFFGTQSWATVGQGPLGFALGDADADGVLDVAAFETGYGRIYSGSTTTGRAQLLRGGAALQGTVTPFRSLTTEDWGDSLFAGAGGSADLTFVDLDRDGKDDLVAPAPHHFSHSGAILWWPFDPLQKNPVLFLPLTFDTNGLVGQ